MSELNVAMPSIGGNKVEAESVKPNPTAINVVDSGGVADGDVKKEVEDSSVTDKAVPLTAVEVTEAVKEMNHLLEDMNRNLSFSVDEQSGQNVIVVKDAESDEVIRQIPSEELVVLRKKMDDVVGILFDTKV